MTQRDPELMARLEGVAKTAIATALAESPLPAEARLEDIERVALAAGQQIQQAIAAELAQESAAMLPAWPSCPQCGQKMKTKGKRRRRLVTQAGEVEIERLYYHCGVCGQGFSPPGPALGSEGRQQL